MSDPGPPGDTQVIYLEPDDEIPTVIRRLGAATSARVIVVAPGRTKATSSAIAVRLIARAARDAGREVVLVADAAARSLAAEAGLAAYASVGDAQGAAPPAEAAPRPRAAIRVVRGEGGGRLRTPVSPAVGPQPAPPKAPPGEVSIPASGADDGTSRGWESSGWASGPGDETREVPTVRPGPPPRGPAGGKREAGGRRLPPLGRRGWSMVGVLAALLLAAASALLPAATVTIVPAVKTVGPYDYTVEVQGHVDSGELTTTLQGQATGEHVDATPAKGTVVFTNYNLSPVTVPKGTQVSGSGQAFATDAAVSLGRAVFVGLNLRPSTGSVSVSAVKGGPDGNVAAGAIDTVDSSAVAGQLWPYGGTTPREVNNPDALTGGTSTTQPEVTQGDVDGLVAAVEVALGTQLTEHIAASPDRAYAPPAADETASVPVPDGLVGTVGQTTFQLSGTLAYSRTYASVADLESEATRRLGADARAVPGGSTLVPSTVAVKVTRLVAEGGIVTADAAVSGGVASSIDENAVRSRISGLTAAQAEAELADLGSVHVDLWPGWVGEVPRLAFRIAVQVGSASPSASPTFSVVPASAPPSATAVPATSPPATSPPASP
jgi:hypothetical protein